MNLKKEALKVLGGLCFIIGLIFFLAWLNLGFWLTIVFFATMILLFTLVKAIKNKQPISFWQWVKSVFLMFLFFGFIRLLNIFLSGIVAYIVTIAAICGYMLYRRREKYMQVKWTIEKKIWGSRLKDLPKSYWQK
jgi:ABC-type antimicrobial peptide transport system permease subunit